MNWTLLRESLLNMLLVYSCPSNHEHWRDFYLFFWCRGTSLRQSPSDPLLQSKPQFRAPHSRKFPYTKLVKSLAFHQRVWPQRIVCTHKVLNLGPWRDETLRPRSPSLGPTPWGLTLKGFLCLSLLLHWSLCDGVYRGSCIVFICTQLLLLSTSYEVLFHVYLKACEVVQTRFLFQGSRKLNYKGLVRDCLAIMCGLSQIQSTFSNNKIYPENSVAKPPDNCDTVVAIALPEIGKKTCIAMQKLLILVCSSTSFSSGHFESVSLWALIWLAF